MTREEIIQMAEDAGFAVPRHEKAENLLEFFEFAKLVAEREREAIAQMVEDAPPLVHFCKNNNGGCLVCGFTPSLAAKTIRARGQA